LCYPTSYLVKWIPWVVFFHLKISPTNYWLILYYISLCLLKKIYYPPKDKIVIVHTTPESWCRIAIGNFQFFSKRGELATPFHIFRLMLHLFRRKIVSVVKWFQGSHFSGNHFPSKAFFGVWRVRKIANIFYIFIHNIKILM
jgi:hypothetical protein